MKSSRLRHRITTITKLPHLLTQLVLVSVIATIGSVNLLTAVIAAPLSAGTTIKNTAVGSFLDEDTPATALPTVVESNEVTVTVAEIAGINVTSAGVSEAAATVANAGIYQGDGTINAGDIVYYDYLITNVGNDPTQFFIPGSPSNVSSGGTFNPSNPIQVIAYNLTGTSVALSTAVTVPVGGSVTGPSTATATTGGLLAKNGIIPPGGSITIRVPITISTSATVNQAVSVIMGNTSPNDNSAATQNQVYLNNNNQDIYTQDNPDGTTNAANVVIETVGDPLNGDSTLNGNTTNNHRQEASATAQSTVVLPLVQGFKSVKLTADADNSATITATSSVANSPSEILTWTISYINNSSTTSIPNFQIADQLPTNVPITTAGAQTITINTAQGSTLPAKNTSYTGASTTLGASVNNLLASPITLLPGGVITVSIPVKINAGTLGLVSNQSIATGTGLIATGVKTDNVDRTTTNLPTGITVPVDSVIQTQNNTIDPTTATVLASTAREYVVSPDRDKIIINEVLYLQSDGNDALTNDEFIELYNSSSTTVDLTGWKLIDGNIIQPDIEAGPTGTISGSSTIPFIFGNSFPSVVVTDGNPPVLGPGQYAVIWVGAKTATKQAAGATFQAWLGQSVRLSNVGDDVWLYDNQTRIVDYVAFGTGSSINTRPPATFLNNTFWNSTYEAHAATGKGQSISLTPNGQNPVTGHTSGCWEPTTSGAAASPATRCPGALPTRDTDPFVTTATTTPPSVPRITSVGVSNNGAITTSPSVILVKRITGINKNLINPNDGKVLNIFVDDLGTTNDTHPNWPAPVNSYPLGATNGGLVKPKDEVEYTIYFLSTGTATANNVLFCDRVPANVTFVPNAFNSLPVGIGGLSGADRGIAIDRNGSLNSYTNTADGDIARYFPPYQEPTYGNYAQYFPSNDPSKKICNGANDNGAVVTYLGNIPKSVSPGSPNTSYGFVRFRGLVK
jgi:uncharacterized repeat protein (TIGR01451 family)